MPSQLPMPTLSNYVAAFHRGVKAKRNNREDSHTGSVYDYIAGTTAMLLARESAFIRDTFQAIYFDDAEGQDLTDYIAGRYQIERILDTYGTGTATLYRPNAYADAGLSATDRVFWQGTRIIVQSPTLGAQLYQVAQDTPIAAGALYVAGLPIEATATGLGTAVNTQAAGLPCALEDPVWDPSWQVSGLVCGNGTVFEDAATFRARVRATLAENEVGYVTGITNACLAVGAVNVAVFGTNFGGEDLHACATYVGDAGFTGSLPLVQASLLTLESWRMLGADMLIGPMARQNLYINATIQLYDDPSKFDLPTLTTAAQGAIIRILGATGAYSYDLDEFFGAIVEVSDAIQGVTFNSPTSSHGLLVPYPPPNGALWLPQVLTRYLVSPATISLSYVGPAGI